MRSLALFLIFSVLAFGCAESHDPGEDRDASTRCDDLEEQYAEAHREAFRCDLDAAEDPCTERVMTGLFCGCAEFANAGHEDAIDAIRRTQEEYEARGCRDEAIACLCLEPIQGECREVEGEGRCVSDYSVIVPIEP